MPSIGSDNHDRMCGLLEELIEKFEEHLDGQSESPVVVPAPVVNLEVQPAQAKVPAPVVNVTNSAPDVRSWMFTVARDGEGRISTITASPK